MPELAYGLLLLATQTTPSTRAIIRLLAKSTTVMLNTPLSHRPRAQAGCAIGASSLFAIAIAPMCRLGGSQGEERHVYPPFSKDDFTREKTFRGILSARPICRQSATS